jgi:hypothetical protein
MFSHRSHYHTQIGFFHAQFGFIPCARLVQTSLADDIARLHATSWRTAYRGALSDTYPDGSALPKLRIAWRSAEALATGVETLFRPEDGHGKVEIGVST